MVGRYASSGQFGKTQNFLKFVDTQIVSDWSGTIDSKQVLIVITKGASNSTVGLYEVTTFKKNFVANFTLIQQIQVSYEASKVSANEQLIAVGCDSCNNGLGKVYLYQTKDFSALAETFGRDHILQMNTNTSSFIWTTTGLRVVATVLWQEESKNTALLIAEQSAFQAQNLSSVDNMLLFADKAGEVVSVHMCRAGYELSGVSGCQPCRSDEFSLGLQTGCQGCKQTTCANDQYCEWAQRTQCSERSFGHYVGEIIGNESLSMP